MINVFSEMKISLQGYFYMDFMFSFFEVEDDQGVTRIGIKPFDIFQISQRVRLI